MTTAVILAYIGIALMIALAGIGSAIGVSIGGIIFALPSPTSLRNLVVEDGWYLAGNLLVHGFLNI